MVSRIVADLASMARLAGADASLLEGKVVETSPHVLAVGGTELVLAPSAWDPASCRGVLEGVSSEPDAELPESILNDLLAA